MNATTSILPKTISSSTHSVRNSFKLYNQQPTQKLVVPFVKLQHLFIKKNKGKHHHKFSQTRPSLHKNKNVSYINLGIDEDELNAQSSPKGTFPNRLKIKETRTDRNDQTISNSNFDQKPKQQKRHRHQSLVNMVEQYTLFTQNREKDNLQKFQKKLIDSLTKKQNSDKTNELDTTHGLRFVSYFKTQPVIDSQSNGVLAKPKEEEKIDSSVDKGFDKWKRLALKHQNSKNLPFNAYALNALNTTQPLQKGKKKLTRRYSKQNTTLSTIYPQFRAGQNSQLRKSKILQKIQQKQNNLPSTKQNSEPSIFVKQKFKLAKFIKTFEGAILEDELSDSEEFEKWESSKNKLKKFLKNTKDHQAKEKNLVFTPWDCQPSDRGIELNYHEDEF